MAWIRSQDKTKLIDVNNIRFTHYGNEVSSGYNIETFQNTLGWITLGVYSTKEKALKVLDMIQETIIQNETIYAHTYSGSGVRDYNIFQMPADEEV